MMHAPNHMLSSFAAAALHLGPLVGSAGLVVVGKMVELGPTELAVGKMMGLGPMELGTMMLVVSDGHGGSSVGFAELHEVSG